MKPYFAFVTLAMATSYAAYSQDRTGNPAPPAEVSPLEAPVKKNELSIDLIPLIKIASTPGEVYDLKGTVQYKRQVKNGWFFRFSASVSQKKLPRPYHTISSTPVGNDSARVSYQGTEHKPQLNLDAGLEYRWGKRRIKQFTGIDIGYIHKETVYSEYARLIPNYSYYSPYNYRFDQFNEPDLRNNAQDKIRSSSQTANGVVLTPFYGVQFHFSKRLFFSMQLGLPMQFLSIQNNNLHKPPHYQTRIFEFNLGEDGILNNFSLGFRF